MFDIPQPILLPQTAAWGSLADVEANARAFLDACGLQDWGFVWDHAIRRMGCCKIAREVISMSCYFAEKYLVCDPDRVRTTLLHELAHALAWVRHHEGGHDAAWRYWCVALGIPGEKASCKCEDFTPPHLRKRQKYALCHGETGEVYRYYSRKPRMSAQKLARSYIPGKKAETLGKLCIISVDLTQI